MRKGSSGQDGGVGRNPSLPCTTKRRKTTNLKSINNQKCRKIKLHGTLTTTELKKQSNRTARWVRQWTERTKARRWTMRAGLAENPWWDSDCAGMAGCSKAVGCRGGADFRGN